MRNKTVEAEGLGTVTVQSMKLTERMRLRKEAGDDTGLFIIGLLEGSVLDSAGQRLKTADEWDEYGGDYQAEVMRLFDVASEVNGLIPEEAKKK